MLRRSRTAAVHYQHLMQSHLHAILSMYHLPGLGKLQTLSCPGPTGNGCGAFISPDAQTWTLRSIQIEMMDNSDT